LKQLKTIENVKIKEKENREKLQDLKAELIKREYQDNLSINMEKRLDEFVKRLTNVNKNMSTIEIKNLLSQKNVIGISPKYNTSEIAILFNYYKQFINQINDIQRYLPTKKDFCSFIGISSNQYDRWRQSEDSERAEIMQMIDDYITDLQLTSAQNGDIKEISTIYRTKSEHGMVEATAPIVIEHKSEVNTDRIMQQLKAINEGKSLKSIELEKQQNGIYKYPEEE